MYFEILIVARCSDFLLTSHIAFGRDKEVGRENLPKDEGDLEDMCRSKMAFCLPSLYDLKLQTQMKNVMQLKFSREVFTPLHSVSSLETDICLSRQCARWAIQFHSSLTTETLTLLGLSFL